MKRSSLKRQRLAALALFGMVLLTYPVLGLSGGMWAGFPSAVLYLFAVWGGLILLAALVAERRDE